MGRNGERQHHIEAAGLEGHPTAWEVMGPWKKAEHNPDASSGWKSSESIWFLVLITIAALAAAPLLARRNLLKGSGDRQGAFRAASFIFVVQIALWLSRAHFTFAPSGFGMAFIAVATSVFFAAHAAFRMLQTEPDMSRHNLLLGGREAIGAWLVNVPGSIRYALLLPADLRFPHVVQARMASQRLIRPGLYGRELTE